MELSCRSAAGRRGEPRPVPGTVPHLASRPPPSLLARFAAFVGTRQCFFLLPFVLAERMGAAGGRGDLSLPQCHRGDAAGTGQAAPGALGCVRSPGSDPSGLRCRGVLPGGRPRPGCCRGTGTGNIGCWRRRRTWFVLFS